MSVKNSYRNKSEKPKRSRGHSFSQKRVHLSYLSHHPSEPSVDYCLLHSEVLLLATNEPRTRDCGKDELCCLLRSCSLPHPLGE